MTRSPGHWPDWAIPYVVGLFYACFWVLAFVIVGGYVPLMVFGHPDWYAGGVAGTLVAVCIWLEGR